MLESGRLCVSCDRKKFLKDIDRSSNICWSCLKDGKDLDDGEQFQMALKFDKKDKSISSCKCGRLFKNRNGHHKECDLCRNEFGMQGLIEQQSKLREGNKTIKRGEGLPNIEKQKTNARMRNINRTQSIERKCSQSEGPFTKTINSEKMQEEKNIDKPIRRPTMPHNEHHTQETENTDLVLSEQEELEETLSMDLVNCSKGLRAENSSSLTLLTESATLLNTSASRLLQGQKGDFAVEGETDSVLRVPTINEAETALKLALGANEIMKTKLEYIKVGSRLVQDLLD